MTCLAVPSVAGFASRCLPPSAIPFRERLARLSAEPFGVMSDASSRQRILRKAQAELLRAVSKHHSKAAIENAAEDVRAAMLLLFKGQRELIIYKDHKTSSELQHLANFERKTSDWLSKSVDEIVRHCQAQCP